MVAILLVYAFKEPFDSTHTDFEIVLTSPHIVILFEGDKSCLALI